MRKQIILIAVLATISFCSCRKYLDVGPPPVQLISSTVFESDNTAIAALLAVYAQFEGETILYNLTIYTAFSSDEGICHNLIKANSDLFTANLDAENSNTASLWSKYYSIIYQCNAILTSLDKSNGLSEKVRILLEGEARFLRALSYFHLVNLYGDVPFVTSTDYKSNQTLGRTPVNKVYQFIISDLNRAKSILPEDYLDGKNTISKEKVRANKWVAASLLAKVHLFNQSYEDALREANEIIESKKFSLLMNLDEIFLKNSSEAIFQIQSLAPRNSTLIGNTLILTTTPSLISVSEHIFQSFEDDDKRQSSWIRSITSNGNAYYYCYKYKIRGNVETATEYNMMIRLAEIYLIRAEARAYLGNFDGAVSDLNAIRLRAGLVPTSADNVDELISAINQERKIELMFECGNRWLDLKRTGTIDDVLSIIKGTSWNPEDALYPIPLSEILRSPNLTQNPGY